MEDNFFKDLLNFKNYCKALKTCSNEFNLCSDLDGNGFWDANEVKALFSKELDKVYDPNAPEDDMAERYEEMERMREHVFNETDVNKDYLIS